MDVLKEFWVELMWFIATLLDPAGTAKARGQEVEETAPEPAVNRYRYYGGSHGREDYLFDDD